MRVIVADSAGTGTLWDEAGAAHELAPDAWAETDVRDVIVAGAGPAWVRYREDGHTVEIAAGQRYEIEAPPNEDVLDIRSATPAAQEIQAAMDGVGTDEDRIFRALETAPADNSRADWIAQLRFLFGEMTGRTLDDALADELSGAELERAQHLLR